MVHQSVAALYDMNGRQSSGNLPELVPWKLSPSQWTPWLVFALIIRNVILNFTKFSKDELYLILPDAPSTGCHRKIFLSWFKDKQTIKALAKTFWLSSPLLSSSKQTYPCTFKHKCIHPTMGASQQRYKAVLVNMSQPLKQSSIARGALTLYLLHEFICHSRETKERESLVFL